MIDKVQDSDDAQCPHCDEESIREAKVADVEPGWENDPPSLDSLSMARVCYICLCGWTMTGEFVRRGQSCSGSDTDERSR